MNANDLLDAARSDLDHGFTVRAATRYRQAIDAGSNEALCELTNAMFRRNVPGNSRELRQRLEGARAPSPQVLMLRSRWRYAGLGGEMDRPGALSDLCRAADSDPAARIELALVWDEQARGSARTVAWLMAGDADGELLAAAGDAGVTSGVAEAPESWSPIVLPETRETYARSPAIYAYDQLLSPLECAWLRGRVAAALEPSRVIDPRTGRSIDNPIRTGRTACLDPSHPGVFDLRIAERMAVAGDSTLRHAEPLAVLHYAVGQQYRPHFDWIGPAGLTRDPMAKAGDRRATVLGYLNTPERGGGTAFPRLELLVPAQEGRVLVFANISAGGEPLEDSQHTGEPVGSGEKWLASLWLREGDLTGY